MSETIESNGKRGEIEPAVRRASLNRPLTDEKRRGLAERLVLFVAAFLLWLLLDWPVTPSFGRLQWGDIAVGLVVAGFVALVMREVVTQQFARLLDPRRYVWAVIYLIVFTYYVVKASVDVAYRVLHPAMPIRPGIVRVKSTLRSASARTALANSITLTPGTLTVDVDKDGTFYVHWINVLSLEPEKATGLILGRFEGFIRRIFE